MWNAADGSLIKPLMSDGYPSELQFSPDAKALAAVSKSGQDIRIWNTADWTESMVYSDPSNKDSPRIGFSPDSRILVSAGSTAITISFLPNREVIQTLTGFHPSHVAFDPRGRFFVIAQSEEPYVAVFAPERTAK